MFWKYVSPAGTQTIDFMEFIPKIYLEGKEDEFIALHAENETK